MMWKPRRNILAPVPKFGMEVYSPTGDVISRPAGRAALSSPGISFHPSDDFDTVGTREEVELGVDLQLT